MKKLYITVLLASVSMFSSQVFAGDCWKTLDDKTGQAKSYVETSGSTGVIKHLVPADPAKLCTACKGSDKDKPIEGLTIIRGMKIGADDGVDKSGTIMDPKDGKKYSLKVWKEGGDLKVRGYIGFFYRTQTWKPAPGKCN